jgi:hypothetical protein
MKIEAHAFRLKTLLVAISVGSLTCASSSGSTIVAYSFSGTLKTVTGLTGAVAGDPISGSFAYDSSQTGSGGSYTFTGSSKVHTFTFYIYNMSGQQIFHDSYTGDATVATGGYYAGILTYGSTSSGGTNFSLEGDTITKYDGGLGTTGTAFDLTLNNSTNAGGYTSTNLPLPTSSTIQDFNLNSGLLTWDPTTPQGTLYFMTNSLILTPTGVPEPSSLVIAVLGLSTCGVGSLFARRRRADAVRSDQSASRS